MTREEHASLPPDGVTLTERLREGLGLRCVDITPCGQSVLRCLAGEKRLKVLLVLEGDSTLSIDGCSIPLGAGCRENECSQGCVVSLNGTETVEWHGEQSFRHRMIMATLSKSWIQAAGLQDIIPGNCVERGWTPAPRTVAIAEQLLYPAAFDGPMYKLYLESRILELIADAIAQISGSEQSAPPGLTLQEYRRVRRLRDMLDNEYAAEWSIPAIAMRMGCNANTLQRHFRLAFGSSIFEHLRMSRLREALRALRQDGASVSRAAEIAGYSSQANFSTAFRRVFGISPKACRARL